MSMGFDPVLSTVHVVKNELAGGKKRRADIKATYPMPNKVARLLAIAE